MIFLIAGNIPGVWGLAPNWYGVWGLAPNQRHA